MAIKQWKTFLMPYQQAVEELKIKFKSIRKEFKFKNEYSPIEFVTGRVKEVASILEKVKKFNIPIDRIEFELEDIAGIRIMCQFVDDIMKVVNIIRKRKDLTILYEKDYITNVKESGYRSYHIIIKYPVNLSIGCKEIISEIQIRTLGMNFWATAEHSLNYKYKQHIPNNLKNKLKQAADTVYKLDELMMQIKDEIRDAQRLFDVKSHIVSNITDALTSLISLGGLKEFTNYQMQLTALIEIGDVNQLNSLLLKIQRDIDKYKNF
ncbi:RelA/SpoT domain-containing protein [Candidatus Arthromitus sp. SFB-mouse-Japan]|uniref:GTP pyrophosphokinase n=1 Tax=unclassified Candidatus Neoarthromitus TaxID=2638829 RepID=UPI00021B8116|nr:MULTISPECIES: GTP pyrophosphokinase family protein [unclassified Candidatus Arthromitus]AID45307.1 GTP pyrophosphokinase [Candidatus Arthromitus sp. SFB-mouse-NL]EGX28221.1 GTP diphosphokinase [Candidatus Arthromitus sp. SFB-mouse-NYU]BAK57096.1 RelA/SpoT domain-containing protein [Candidatus Arthromitus sp. SFB-mouse-Japan]BAK80389.1 RelA/spoT family protein [Candidatus Arthromitus sp. SFB-mouse-Yit]